MLSSKIKPGLEVVVFIDRLQTHDTYLTHGGEQKGMPQIMEGRGIPQDAKSNLSNEHRRMSFAKATVVAVGHERFARTGKFSRYHTRKNDGILVEFSPPVQVRRMDRHTAVARAVVTAKFVVMTAEEFDNQVKAELDAKAARLVRVKESAESFGPRLQQFRDQLEAIGIKTELHADKSGLYSSQVSIPLNTSRDDNGETVATSFGSSSVRLDRKTFENLVAIAAAHDEVV